MASNIRVFNSLRQLFILARRRFSMIGLLLCKENQHKSNAVDREVFVCKYHRDLQLIESSAGAAGTCCRQETS